MSMWRLLQNIPRGTFRNFGVRPAAKCREDEKEAAHKVNNARQLVLNARLSHNKAILTQILRTSDQHYGEYQDSGTEDFRRKSFTRDFWTFVGRPCNTAEVVGWGALVIVGIQLGKLYPKHRSVDGDRNPYCPVNWIECAIKLLQEKPSWQAAKNVFGTDYRLQYDSIIKHEQLPETSSREKGIADKPATVDFKASTASSYFDDTESYISPKFQAHSLETNVVPSYEQKPISEVVFEKRPFEYKERKTSLQQAGKEWEDLTQEFTSLVLNEAGLQRAEEGQFPDAIALWDEASRSGCAKAHYNLAVCYENGNGCKKDLERACKHYEIAAAGGHVKAQYNLAVLYLEGAKGLQKNPQKALQLLEFAAKSGLKQAQTELGVLYTEDERKDLERAAGLFKLAADQKDNDGIFYLGICYENGWGVPENHCKAADLYRQAAKEGHCTAQYNLAEHGMGGVPQDKKSAADMYEKAALLGERGAEEQAKRLRRETKRLELKEHFRWQFDGGTHLKHSRSSPILRLSKPSLAQYVQKHLPEFGFADLNIKMDSDADTSVSRRGCGDSSSYIESNSVSLKATFQLGEDDNEELSDAKSKFWYDNEDSLIEVQSTGNYWSTVDLQSEISMSRIELQAIGGGSHELRVS